MVGECNEVAITIAGKSVSALLDTGSTVSTVSESFYKCHLPHLELQSLTEVLDIECASGTSLPYLGFIEAEIGNVPGMDLKNRTFLLLVVPDSRYNSQVPILLGTNILIPAMNTCKQRYGERYLQNHKLDTPWYLTFRCLSLRDRDLARKNWCLGVVKLAGGKAVNIPSNSKVTVQGIVNKAVDYIPTCAILQPSNKSAVTSDLDITPGLVHYDSRNVGIVPITLSNVTMRNVTIPPRAVICELHPVTVEGTVEDQEVPTDSDFRDLLHLDTENLTVEQLGKTDELLKEFADVFSKGDLDLGHCADVSHRIELEDVTPFRQRYRRIPPNMVEEVRDHLRQLAACGVIRRSHSPWSSCVVLARKRDGSLRMCIDYRQLNRKTVNDAYAMPRIDEILDSLHGSKFFTVLDMKSGYHQVEVLEEHKQRTAFTVGPLGLWEFNRMPFGLVNAPATYQRLMEDCMGDYIGKLCFIYLDDLIIFSETFEEHMDRLAKVMQRLREHGLKLSPKKCFLLQSKVKYLGFVVSENGVEADPEKVSKIKEWKTPSSPDELRQFLGFSGYYRRFVKNFSVIAKPLNDLLPPTNKKRSKTKSRKLVPWNWGKEQQDAFDRLKDILTSPPVLGYPDFSLPFELHIDASSHGLGAVLYQTQEGHKRVISYASRGLNKSERNYPAHKMEFLALKWAVTDKFPDYLYGAKFTVFTDNNPLTYVLSTAKLDATGHRWVAALSAYDFDIKYIPGRNNTDADFMSRIPEDSENRDSVEISLGSIKAVCAGLQNESRAEIATCTPVDDIDDLDTLELMSLRDWRKVQGQDATLRPIIRAVKEERRPARQNLTPDQATFMRSFDKLMLEDGVLYRRSTKDGEIIRQLVLPSAYVCRALKLLHTDVGHPGRDRTLSLIQDRFFWPGMTKDVEEWVQNCTRCIRRKTPTTQRAPLVNITTTQPMELVCIDFLTLEPAKGGFQHILVLTDHFTRYAQAFPTRNMTARTTAEVLFNNFFVHYGFPLRLHSDQGANFVGKVVHELCQISGIRKSQTTPYHAMGNGMCERFNRTLLNMLGTLEPDQKTDWKKHVAPLVHAYNSTRHENTGQTPFFLMFGRQPRLPVDLAFGIKSGVERKSYSKYISDLREKLKCSYARAANESNLAGEKRKEIYDRKVRGSSVQEGDRVLVKKLVHDGKHKLADKWEDDIYIVVNQRNPDIPVFDVKPESKQGRTRTLHRNLLLPIGGLLWDVVNEDTTEQKSTKTSITRKGKEEKETGDYSVANSDEDNDDDLVVVFRNINPTVNVSGASASTGDDTDIVQDEVASQGRNDDSDTEETGVVGNSDDGHTSSEEEGFSQTHHEPVPTEIENEEGSASDTDAKTTVRTPPVPIPRTSTRSRRKPEWQTKGEFVMSQTTATLPDWMLRAQYIEKLAENGTIDRMTDRAFKVFMMVLNVGS